MTSSMPAHSVSPAKKENRKSLIALLFAGFVLTGIPTVIMGPILPVFIARFSLNDAQAGLFFTVFFATSLAGVWLNTALSSWRGGYRWGLVTGYLLTGAGLSFFDAPRYLLAVLAASAFGLGYGFISPSTNLTAAEVGGKSSAGLVSLLNFAWGVGAVACSPLILMAVREHTLTALLLVLGACAWALAAAFVFVWFPSDGAPEESGRAASDSAGTPDILFTTGVASLFFVYVGTEASVGGWAAEHAKRLSREVSSLAMIAPTFFYGGLMAGRAVGTLVLATVRGTYVMAVALSLAAAGVATVIAAPSQRVAVTGLAIAGLGCASIYPLYISWFSRWYGAAARKFGGLVFSMASLGGSALPWLVGVTSMGAGSLRTGLLVPLTGCLVMATVVALLQRQRSV
jgi:MFS transporter, FHS family, glucose/mannose:H+ symporter